MKATLFIIVFLSVLIQTGYGQDVRSTNLRWSVSGLNDLRNSKAVSYNCVFETRGTKTIVWKQRNETYLTNLSVTSVEGAWGDFKTNGKIIYNITCEGQTGSLTFERDGSAINVTLDLSQSNGAPRLSHRYTVVKTPELN